MTTEFTERTMEQLHFYVYALYDPRTMIDTMKPFYIGKGQRNRCFNHAATAAELAERAEQTAELSDKVAILQDILKSGAVPHIEILRHGMTESEAVAVEATLIEFVGLDGLTNEVSGHGSLELGRSPVGSLEAKYGAKDVVIVEPTMLFNVSKLFDPKQSYSAEEVQTITSQWWKVNLANAQRAQFALAVRHGVVRAVYQIHSWEPPVAGTEAHREFPTRHRFLGTHVPDSPYMYGKVGHHFNKSSSPFVYVNVPGVGVVPPEGE